MLKLKNILFPISVRYNSNTIYALSSGHGTCGVAVIRITGMFSALKIRKKMHNFVKSDFFVKSKQNNHGYLRKNYSSEFYMKS